MAFLMKSIYQPSGLIESAVDNELNLPVKYLRVLVQSPLRFDMLLDIKDMNFNPYCDDLLKPSDMTPFVFKVTDDGAVYKGAFNVCTKQYNFAKIAVIHCPNCSLDGQYEEDPLIPDAP
jgi:hypothetical protein